LVGVLPLYGARHAEFLHNEVPGVFIPDAVREQVRRAGEDGPQEGVRMARELLAELCDLVQGVYLMPAFNRFDLVAEVIESIRSPSLGDWSVSQSKPQPVPVGTTSQGDD
jgi:homocysteine S-methyltransferase